MTHPQQNPRYLGGRPAAQPTAPSKFQDDKDSLEVFATVVRIIKDLLWIIVLLAVLYYGYKTTVALSQFGDRMNQLGQLFGN